MENIANELLENLSGTSKKCIRLTKQAIKETREYFIQKLRENDGIIKIKGKVTFYNYSLSSVVSINKLSLVEPSEARIKISEPLIEVEVENKDVRMIHFLDFDELELHAVQQLIRICEQETSEE